jgi:UDP-galactopyranose mutase
MAVHQRSSWIFSKNTYTRYPFQTNTYRLPAEVIKDCLFNMIEVCIGADGGKPSNFKNWILDSFGKGVAEHFMFPYNLKLWRTPLHSIDIDWVNRFVPKANVEQAIKGAFSDFKKAIGYNRIFYYPKTGGIQTIAEALYNAVRENVCFRREAVRIFLKDRTMLLSDGQHLKFDTLISTMPLPELIKIIDDAPQALRKKAQQLKYVSVFNLNIGVGRGGISDKHWVYFPEKEYIFYRVGFLSNFSKAMASSGKTSIYTEVSYSKDKPLKYNNELLKKRIIKDLIKSGILTRGDNIISERSYDIRYAYPLHDTKRKKLVRVIKRFLRQHNVLSIGRYGSWRYMTMEDCILEGRLAANNVSRLCN